MNFFARLVIVVTLVAFGGAAIGQTSTRLANPLGPAPAELFDEFGQLGSEDRSARFDNLFYKLSQEPGSMGYVLLYCGKKCSYGEIAAHFRGIEIKTAVVKFDRSRLILLDAGFRA